MSLMSAISNSLSGLAAVQAGMQIVSANISNAQRADYTSKSLILSSNDASGGVTVMGYARAESPQVLSLLRKSLSDNGLSSSQNDYMNRIQVLLGSSQDNPVIVDALSDFASAWQQLATAPEDANRKQDVIYKGQNLAREVRRLAEGLDKIAADTKVDMEAATSTLNSSLSRIASLNDEIVSAGNGQSAVDLRDQRDVEIQKLAGLMKINVVEGEQGRIRIYTPNGFSLLDRTASQFTWDGTTLTHNGSGADVGNVLKGGELEALVGMLDQGSSPATLNDPGKASIYKIQQQLDKIVQLFTSSTGTFATAYDSATTGTGELASGFFSGTTRYAFDVNASLANGTSKLKQAAAAGVSADMQLSNRTISAAGISLTNTSYQGFVSGIVYNHTQNLQQVSSLAKVYETQKDDYTKRMQNQVGVNVDNELINLTQLQNTYSANARVLTTIQSMLDALERI